MTNPNDRALRILHVLRGPIGGLIRHVCDLAGEQIARGHHVGLITDSLTGGDRARDMMGALEPSLELGLLRLPIHRLPHPSDIWNAILIGRRLAQLKPDIVHAHGAKGGLFARLPNPFAPKPGPVRVYTPHGGSLHYRKSRTGALFVRAEAMLASRTDLFLFESNYIKNAYEDEIGLTGRNVRVVLNGIDEKEFEPVTPDADSADFVYMGDLRLLKGVDMVIDALADLRERTGVTRTLSIVGTGDDENLLRQHVARLGLTNSVSFCGSMPARKGLARGKTLVAPSRMDSLPYVLIEAAAAQVPIIATNVGGIPEILEPFAQLLVEPNGPAIAEAMHRSTLETDALRAERACALAAFVRGRFNLQVMADNAISGYRDALRCKHETAARAVPALAK